MHPTRLSISNKVAEAASEGNARSVEEYLKKRPEHLNCPSIFQSRLLHIACRCGSLEVVRLLLRLGVDINALDYDMKKTRVQQLLSRRLAVLQLIQYAIGNEVKLLRDVQGGMRRTGLHWACLNGDVRIVELLVDAGADTKVQGIAWSELVRARACGKPVQVDSATPDSPASLCKDDQSWLALHRPQWSPSIHNMFPERFKAAVRVLLQASCSARQQHSAKARTEGGEDVAALDLDWDGCHDIVSRMAYPISAWLDQPGGKQQRAMSSAKPGQNDVD